MTPLAAALRDALAGRWAHVREDARTAMSTADLVHTAGLSSDEHRARVSAQLQALADAGQSRSGFAVAHGGGGDLGASVTGFELLGRGWQLSIIEDREQHLLDTLARRLRRARQAGTDGGADSFAVYNAAQPHVLRLAVAHVERVVLEAFVAGIDGCADPDAAALLGAVCDLFVLDCIEQDKAWFLEHGRLTPAQAKAVTAAVDERCALLRPYATTLVDGFDIPSEWLGAAMLEP